MKNVSRNKIASTDLQETNKQVNVELDRIRDLLDKVPDTFVTSTGGTTTPALTGKYVLPGVSNITANYASPGASGIKVTIPADGIFLINSFNVIDVDFNTAAAPDVLIQVRKNGVVIPGISIDFHDAANARNIHPFSFSFTDTFSAGDVVEVYGGLFNAGAARFYTGSGYDQCFIQYTQLQSNVPVVTTVTKEYACIRISTGSLAGVAAGATLHFDNQEQGNMTFDGANYKVLCKANVKYRMGASTLIDNTGGYATLIQLYNLNTSSYINGAGWRSYGTANYSGGESGAIVNFPVDTWVCVKLSADSSGNNIIYGGRYSWWIIESIEANIPVVATLGQDAYVSDLLDIVPTSATAGYANLYGKVQFKKTSGGTWIMVTLKHSFNITSGSTADILLPGIEVKDLSVGASSIYQKGNCSSDGGSSEIYCLLGNTNHLLISRTGNRVEHYVTADNIILNSKPVGYNIPSNL